MIIRLFAVLLLFSLISVAAKNPAPGKPAANNPAAAPKTARPDSDPEQIRLKENPVLQALQRPADPPLKGKLLIIPDRDQHPRWPYVIEPLRIELARHGWHSYTLRWPDKNAQAAPRTGMQKSNTPKNLTGKKTGKKPAKNNKKTVKKKQNPPARTPSAMDTYTADWIDAAMAHKQAQTGKKTKRKDANKTPPAKDPKALPVVLITYGEGGAAALRALVDKKLNLYLITISSDWRDSLDRMLQIQWLDIVAGHDFTPAVEAARYRRSRMRQLGATKYKTLSIPGTDRDYVSQQKRLIYKVRAWLHKISS